MTKTRYVWTPSGVRPEEDVLTEVWRKVWVELHACRTGRLPWWRVGGGVMSDLGIGLKFAMVQFGCAVLVVGAVLGGAVVALVMWLVGGGP